MKRDEQLLQIITNRYGGLNEINTSARRVQLHRRILNSKVSIQMLVLYQSSWRRDTADASNDGRGVD